MSASSVTMTSCNVFSNTAYGTGPPGVGGGLDITTSSVTMTGCIISSNTADYPGGGLRISTSNVTMSNCTFSSNKGGLYGGGLYIYTSNVTMTSCAVSLNNVSDYVQAPFGYGGGMYIADSVSVILAGCSFVDNVATRYGNDVYVANGVEPDIYSLCSASEANAGAGTTLQIYCEAGDGVCTEIYPADLQGPCSACIEPTPYACCGSTECSSTEPVCSDEQLKLCLWS